MQQIIFSNRYVKMPQGVEYCNTFIKDVTHIDYLDLDPEFVERDTAIVGGGHYPLPNCRLICISLWTDCFPKPVEWTTLRRWTPEKFSYYRSLMGQQVGITFKMSELNR